MIHKFKKVKFNARARNSGNSLQRASWIDKFKLAKEVNTIRFSFILTSFILHLMNSSFFSQNQGAKTGL